MSQAAEETLVKWFPELADSALKVTSESDWRYNCIAWAAGDPLNSWDVDDGYWPPEALKEFSIRGYMSVFETLGYEKCSTFELEEGFEKIAIFQDQDKKPSHIAKQTYSGLWASKIGVMWDIEHDLRGLKGEKYGEAKHFMKRPIAVKK